MSLLAAVRNIGQVYSFREAFGEDDRTSPAMRHAIEAWFRLYFDDTVGPDRNAADRLPYVIVDKLCKTMYAEYEATVGGEGAKAEALRQAMERLDALRVEATQKALVGGECLIKPTVEQGGIGFTVIRRPDYLVLGRDGSGCPTAVGTAERTLAEGKYFTLLERRSILPDGRTRIENRLYRSDSEGVTGTQVPLDTLERYAGLEPDTVLPLPLHTTGLVWMRVPGENCVDGSPDGASIFAPAVRKIEQCYRHEALHDKEFANSASRIVASRDMLEEDGRGGRRLQDDLFVALDDDPASVGITVFNPDIRQAAYADRKNALLREIETLVGFKRGILSEVEAVERTATQVTSSEGDYNTTILQLQEMWTAAAGACMALADWLGQMYLGWDGGGYEAPVLEYGDGVLYNRDKAWEEYNTMVTSGWLKPEYALGWYFGIPLQEEKDFERVRGYMPGDA